MDKIKFIHIGKTGRSFFHIISNSQKMKNNTSAETGYIILFKKYRESKKN